MLFSELETVSRNEDTYSIIASSTANMRRLLFCNNEGARTVDRWRQVGFPNFHGSLFQHWDMPALRTTQELMQFITIRYPGWVVTPEEVAVLLHFSGGVGWIIHDCWAATGAMHPTDAVKETSWAIRTAMDYAANGSRTDPSTAISTVRGAVVAAALIIGSNWVPENSIAALPCIGVDYSLLLRALIETGVDDAASAIDDMIDDSLLYRHTTITDTGEQQEVIQLARPVDAYVYTSLTTPDTRGILLLAAVQLMVHGFLPDDDTAGSDDPTVAYVTAGSALKELVRPRVAMHMGIPSSDIKFYGTKIRVTSEGRLEVLIPTATGTGTGAGAEASAAWQSLSTAMMSQLEYQLLIWDQGTGLDGLILVPLSTGKSKVWELHGWRCKGGHYDDKVTGGILAASEAVFLRDKHVTHIVDNTWHGIVMKAQVGICMLMKAFAVDGITVVPSSVTITTTKDARLAHESLKAVHYATSISRNTAVACDLPLAFWTKHLKNNLINIRLLDGLSWLQACLPHSLRLSASWMESVAARVPATPTSVTPRKCAIQ
jgi:hypothetical protein